jgi:pectin methylesterase-like acyl-CoA thioesterase
MLAFPLSLSGCQSGGSSGSGSTDATLGALSFSAGTLNPSPFVPGTTSYFLSVPFGTPSVTVTASASDPRTRSITVAQDSGEPVQVASGSASPALAVPAIGARSVVKVVVTAEDGRTTKTYGFVVTQLVSHDASLSVLTTSLGTLTPDFSSAKTGYAVSLPAGTASITVTPTASDATASITVAQDSGPAVAVASGSASPALTVLPAGQVSNVAVKVTAQDGTTTRTYTIAVSQLASNDATLSMLTDSAGVLTGPIPSQLPYSYRVPYQAGGYTVTPTAHSPQASITVNGNPVTSGTASGPIALTEGAATTITIVVTAQDRTTQQTYTLDVTEGTKPGLVNARTVPVGPSTPLAVSAGATLPASGATEVPVDTQLRIGFDGAPTLGATGTIQIHRSADGTVVDAINLADPYAIYDGTSSIKKLTTNQTSSKVNVIGGLTTGIDQVRVVNYVPITFSGNTAIIHPHNNRLAYNTQYYVTIDDGVLGGSISGTPFAGITSNTGWTFTTKASAPTNPTTLNVAADNSADFATVQGAIDAVSANGTATIDISPGVYEELLFIRKKSITLRGTDSVATVIQYDNCDGFNPGTGSGQSVSNPGSLATLPAGNLTGGGRAVVLTGAATPVVLDTITIKNLHGQGSYVIPTLPASYAITKGDTSSPTFVNYGSGPVTPAEALYFNVSFGSGNPPTEPGQLIAKHSNFVSYQDTLQVKGWSWFYDCFITGDVDFIWGSANAALFERSEIKSRNNATGASVVQSRAYLGYGSTPTPSTYAIAYPGFVFLNCALTKEDGDFTAYLARSPGAATVSGSAAPYLYSQYDVVSFIDCNMDSHIAAVGWNVTGGNPPGANLSPTPIGGWREYRSFTPSGRYVDVGQRLESSPLSGTSTNPGGSMQLPDAAASTFFRDRATIFGGATDGTYTTTGNPGWNPQP